MSRIIRGFDRSLRFRFIFAQTKEIVEEARIIHQTSTTATVAIGRLLIQAVIMGTELKGDKDSLTLTLQGEWTCRETHCCSRFTSSCQRLFGTS